MKDEGEEIIRVNFLADEELSRMIKQFKEKNSYANLSKIFRELLKIGLSDNKTLEAMGFTSIPSVKESK